MIPLIPRTHGWCIKSPDGYWMPVTFALTREGCWSEAFGYVAAVEGEDWRKRYWNRQRASIAAAQRRGWRLVRVRFEEVRR